ncbi:hypothetical protein B0H13DRAFT_1904981 [Mycena leptocephala]|nr:hypothetical protein B0H13DRAFT_1904981 [Mycena leptocephala]
MEKVVHEDGGRQKEFSRMEKRPNIYKESRSISLKNARLKFGRQIVRRSSADDPPLICRGSAVHPQMVCSSCADSRINDPFHLQLQATYSYPVELVAGSLSGGHKFPSVDSILSADQCGGLTFPSADSILSADVERRTQFSICGHNPLCGSVQQTQIRSADMILSTPIPRDSRSKECTLRLETRQNLSREPTSRSPAVAPMKEVKGNRLRTSRSPSAHKREPICR